MAGINVITENNVDKASDEFFSNLTTESRINEIDGNVMKTDWADQIISAIHYIDNIFDNPKRFLKVEELIVDIEKSKKVDVDSVKHLSKHSEMISDFDAEKQEIKPSRILNSFKEDTFDLYENRFAYSLVHLIEDLMFRMEQANANKKSEIKERFYYGGVTKVEDEDIDCRISMASFAKYNNKDGLPPRVQTKLNIIKNAVSSWKNSMLFKELARHNVQFVTHPIKRTNTILKNPNFQIAVQLWDYLYNYNVGDSDNELGKSTNKINSATQTLINNSLLIYYLVMKSMNANNTIDSKKYDVPLRNATNNILEAATSMLMNLGTGISKEELLNTVSNKYDNVVYVKGIDASQIENKIKDTVKDYLTKVEESYFALGTRRKKNRKQASKNISDIKKEIINEEERIDEKSKKDI